MIGNGIVTDSARIFPEMADDGFPGMADAYDAKGFAKPAPNEAYLDALERMCDTWDMGSIFHSYGDGRANYAPVAGAAAVAGAQAQKSMEKFRFDTDSV
jgi:hypothetical protein